jgi:BirA family biotin operon repressor/biotin-[acetyl-CoA-carboxylase] ligase
MRETITGLAKGITEDGVLLLEDHEGKVHHIHSAVIVRAVISFPMLTA